MLTLPVATYKETEALKQAWHPLHPSFLKTSAGTWLLRFLFLSTSALWADHSNGCISLSYWVIGGTVPWVSSAGPAGLYTLDATPSTQPSCLLQWWPKQSVLCGGPGGSSHCEPVFFCCRKMAQTCHLIMSVHLLACCHVPVFTNIGPIPAW